jgi:hypothetical protein
MRTIHLLHNGRSLCTMTTTYGLPCNWPEGNVWISVGEYERGGDLDC